MGRFLPTSSVLLVLLILLIPAQGWGQDVRIAVIDSEVILQKFTGVQEAERIFKQDVDEWNRDAESRKKEVEDLSRELEAQSLMLSEEKRREKERDYQRKLNEYETYVQSIFGPDGLVAKRNEELLKPIINKIQTLLETMAHEDGYDLILDKADNNVLYADPSYDITNDVLVRLEDLENEGGK